MATVYVELGRNEEALAQLTTAHGAATANYNLGHMLHSRQQTTLAAEHFRRAAELQPGFVQANQMLAQLSGPVTQFAGYSGNTAGAVENGIGSRPDTSAQNRPTPVPNNPAVAAPKDARLEESQIALPTGSKIKISAPIYPTDGNGSDSNQPQNGLRTSTPISAPPSVAPQVSNEKKILLPPSSSEPIEPAADQSLYPSTGHGGPPLNAPTAVPATQPSSRDLTPPSENFPSLLPPVEPSR